MGAPRSTMGRAAVSNATRIALTGSGPAARAAQIKSCASGKKAIFPHSVRCASEQGLAIVSAAALPGIGADIAVIDASR